ncbi:acylphosphatase [Evansella halocellulosilytica]|uniref:acylphosphatase n=1 Tax=Evansella halocellulosilytica TaxID=2011013 RepID=UPI000BB698AA|nr:acylphosphatase [Evansella halocellulosilytica]
MVNAEYKWLPHLEDAVPVAGQGKRISTYMMALEGWRRGIDLTFYSLIDEENKFKLRYSLSYKGNEHHFELSKGDKVTKEAFDICDDKDLTKKYLEKAGVPVPRGEKFLNDRSDDEIISYANQLGYPIVLKPVSANGGKGVFANILNEEMLRETIPYVRDELNYRDVIIETRIPGEKEYRFIVLEDKVLGAMHRIPANVVGDGVHSIRKLIQQKNEFRKKNPHLTSRLIKIDKEVLNLVENAGYSLDSVLEEGKRLFLREQSNLSNGGDSVDVTDIVTPEMERIAIEATKAIPGLVHSGVDMIIDDEHKSGVVIEVNSRPGLGGHLFPMEGMPRDMTKVFIDYYFPETVDIEKSNLYFNFDLIVESLLSRSVKKVELSTPPLGKLYGKRYIVSGKVQGVGYRKSVKKQAQRLRLQGYAKNLSNGEVEIIVSSTNKHDIEDFKKVCFEGSQNSIVDDVIEEEWTKPVKIGFEILDESTVNIDELKLENERVTKELQRLSKDYNKIVNSTSWKISSPIRYLFDFFKKKR